MKLMKKWLVVVAAVMISLVPVAHNAMAHGGGGGFHGGGGGGGWSGGRGGDFGGGGHMPGYHGSGEYHGGDNGDHGNWRHDRNNNNNNDNGNTTNNYNGQVYGGGWVGGYGVADDALAGLAVGTALGAVAAANNSQPATVIVEQPPVIVQQQVAPATVPIGLQTPSLPVGCRGQNINGSLIYQCAEGWYKPYFGASGVYYQVVTPPLASGNVTVQ